MASYDVLLHWNVSDACNLNCSYCFDTHKSGRTAVIDIPGLLKTLDGTGKTFFVKFVGSGEPFAVPNFTEICAEITKKHYLGVNTNLICDGIDEFIDRIDAKKVNDIHASLHIKELERRNLTQAYINNFLKCREKGFNIEAYAVAHPPLMAEVKKHKKFFKEYGIDIKFSFFLGMHNGKKYPDSYSTEELSDPDMAFQRIEIHYPRRKTCNAGYNFFRVKPNGDITPCCNTNKVAGNIYRNINFRKGLLTCSAKFCGCPLNEYYPGLFQKALSETRTRN